MEQKLYNLIKHRRTLYVSAVLFNMGIAFNLVQRAPQSTPALLERFFHLPIINLSGVLSLLSIIWLLVMPKTETNFHIGTLSILIYFALTLISAVVVHGSFIAITLTLAFYLLLLHLYAKWDDDAIRN